MSTMKGVNAYFRQLSDEEIKHQAHREFVGGLWDELGELQLNFLIQHGLKPHHKLLDIGCGCLRGGVHYIRYLDEGNYFGLDINASLIEAGKIEVEQAGLSRKHPTLIVDDEFACGRFGEKFDFIVSVSLFTHLPFNVIVRCLHRARESLLPHGIYYSTFFQAPSPSHLDPIVHQPGGIVTKYDADPFHYSIEELADMAKLAKLELDVIGDWQHPRNQKMAAFSILMESIS
ncbi:class I SAM-dependent methyltransferase [Thiocystis minor]|uniref:class I SAM-dependent methyltransferase n=1 Tax=Thiocystis minor TaxID=61597 RepID=UPI001913704F|nr:class I SAM-dependent methyltransferase [Thiocystis minor]